MKFTFKTTKPTGKYKSFYPVFNEIKLGKNKVGEFSNEGFQVRLAVMKTDKITDNNSNCDWKWITLKQTHKSLEEAKKWVNENFDAITKAYTLKEL